MTGEPWSDFVGFLPWKVTAREEPTRNGVVYLWWRQDGNWKKRSLRRGVRTSRGALDRELVKSAMRDAEALYAKLVAGVPLDVRTPTAALTLGDTEALITDKDRGL